MEFFDFWDLKFKNLAIFCNKIIIGLFLESNRFGGYKKLGFIHAYQDRRSIGAGPHFIGLSFVHDDYSPLWFLWALFDDGLDFS